MKQGDQNNAKRLHGLVGKVTVNKWLPGSIELFTEEFFKQPADLPPGPIYDVADSIRLPDDLPSEAYMLSIAVISEEDTEPVVQLGVRGRDEDGFLHYTVCLS